MKTVYISEPIHPAAVRFLEERCRIVHSYDGIERIDAVILRAEPITRDIMTRAKNLKVIGRHGVGMNNVDLAAARELGIPVVYTPGANSTAVAELIVGLALCLIRNIAPASERMRRGGFPELGPASLRGREITGKTVGLIGYGNIARLAGRMFRQAFGARVLFYDPYVADGSVPLDEAEKVERLEDCAAQADILNVSVPLTPETANLVNAKFLSLCKPDAVLINAARGGIVDEDALYEALRSGGLRAAACDVFLAEPDTRGHPLLTLERFIGLPHIGADTEEAMYRMAMMVARDVLAVLEGRPPQHPYL